MNNSDAHRLNIKSNFVSGFKLTVKEQRDWLNFQKSLTEV